MEFVCKSCTQGTHTECVTIRGREGKGVWVSRTLCDCQHREVRR
jgi:hypothetical protein